MSKKTEITFDLIKSILFGLVFPAFFCWLTICDPKFLNPIERDFRLILQKKIVTNGMITKAEGFEEFVEVSDTKSEYVDGFEYSYEFFSLDGKKITSDGFTYLELPNNKEISQIPFQVNIEYLEENPEINRIAGLRENNQNLWDMLRKTLLLPLLLFIFCGYFTFKIIQRGLLKYKKEINYYRENTKINQISD